jgi:hypothetical protein
MKDITIISVLLFLINFTCLGQTRNTKFQLDDDDRLTITLNGNVRSAKVKNETFVGKFSDSLDYFFNEKGFPDKIIYYGLGLDVVLAKKLVNEEVHYTFKEGKLLSKLNKLSFGNDGDVYEYDENWNLTLLKEYYTNILVKETSFKYDDKNRMTEKTEYLFGGFSDYNPKTQEGKSNYLRGIEKYEYNNRDKVVLKLTYKFWENKTVEMTQYKYDEHNNLIEEGNCLSYGDPNCTIKPLFAYEYNSKNLLARKYQLAKFSPNNTDEYYFYDDKGNEVEVKGIYIYPDKEPFIGYNYKSEYDKFGNKIKEQEITGNYRSIRFEKYKIQITQYDNFQNMTLDEFIASDGSNIKTVKKVYNYDKKGNWINMETYEGKNQNDLKLVEISKREIKYFN